MVKRLHVVCYTVGFNDEGSNEVPRVDRNYLILTGSGRRSLVWVSEREIIEIVGSGLKELELVKSGSSQVHL